jgi:S1-C subfamily serine protease
VDFNGKSVGTVDELHKELGEGVIGRSTRMEVLRNGHKALVNVIPGEMK